MKILVSAGEASGDRHTAELVAALRRRLPKAQFFGAAGPAMRAEGVRAAVEAESLAVIGMAEVLRDLPRIRRDFRKLLTAAAEEKPDLAIVTDAPGFNVRIAERLRPMGIPVVYYVAPQIWAWRPWRIRQFRRAVDLLLCIFPFEEEYFRKRGVPTHFVGHPLASSPDPVETRREYFERRGLDLATPLLAVLPGSRKNEAERHLPDVNDALRRLRSRIRFQVVLPASSTTSVEFFRERVDDRDVLFVDGEARDALKHADAALIASGTATVEAALLGTPMAVFYKVSTATWLLGRPLVRVPFYSMVNLLAERKIVPELIQGDCRGDRMAEEMERLLTSPEKRRAMRYELAEVRRCLDRPTPAAEQAVEILCEKFSSVG